jgi:dTDP-4-dehydrorhamnose 3,5-epimerase
VASMMQIFDTLLNDLKVVETAPIVDSRGAFSRLYCEDELKAVIGERRILQINHSRTDIIGAVRGLHYQFSPHAEMKLVRCLKGRVWDIAVDLRCDSPTFLHWHAEELTSANARMMVIPEGFAHGFQVLDPSSELLYLHTANYAPSAEGGLRHDDPRIGIRWPLTVTDLSQRDATHPLIKTNFSGVVL